MKQNEERAKIEKLKFRKMGCKDQIVDLNCKIVQITNKINQIVEVLNEK